MWMSVLTGMAGAPSCVGTRWGNFCVCAELGTSCSTAPSAQVSLPCNLI